MTKYRDMVECFLEAQDISSIPAELLVSIAYVESGLNPYAVNLRTRVKVDDLLEGINYRRTKRKSGYMYSIYPRTLATGIQVLRIAEVYGDYDVGVMQINRINIKTLKERGVIRSTIDLLDPCVNIKAGAYILSLCIDRYGLTPRAIDCYNKGARGAKEWSGYVRKVSAILSLLMEVATVEE